MIEYWMTVVSIGLIFSSLAMSYNIAVGFAGMMSLAHASFFGVGAYTYALIGTSTGNGALFLPSLLVGFVLAALAGVLLSAVLTWLPKEYIVLVTFSIALIVTAIMFTAVNVTKGAGGIPGIPFPEVFGYVIFDGVAVLIMTATLAAVTLAISLLMARYPLGLGARMMRDDAVAAEGLGVSEKAVSTIYFSVSAGLAGVAGVVFAGAVLYVDPVSFSLHESILILSMVAIGGLGNPWGALFGGLFISMLPQLVQLLQLSGDAAAGIHHMTYGLLLILIMILRPVGLIPEGPIVNKRQKAAV